MTAVLFVCTGNVCRSPFAEIWLTHRLKELGAAGVEIGSAGTHALVGHGVAKDTAHVLRHHGVEDWSFAARQLTPDHLDSAELVLTATREHRAVAARMRPAALRRMFTVRQVARLVAPEAASSSAGGVSALRAIATQARGSAPSAGNNDDVPDPWGGELVAHQRAAEAALPSLEVIANWLKGW